MIQLLTHKEVLSHRAEIEDLFFQCKFESTGVAPSKDFCASKIDELINYLAVDRAYLFSYIENNRAIAFLWACVLGDEANKKMHLLYCAVDSEHRGKGIGSQLLDRVENKARDLGIRSLELNVTPENYLAQRLYTKLGYRNTCITMTKEID